MPRQPRGLIPCTLSTLVPCRAIYGTKQFTGALKNMGKSHLALVTPTSHYGTAVGPQPPPRQRNADVRAREYLTGAEIDRLIAAAGNNRHGHRNATMILVAYRHGLRVSELVTLRWHASTSVRVSSMSIAPRMAPQPCISSPALNCGPCVGSN